MTATGGQAGTIELRISKLLGRLLPGFVKSHQMAGDEIIVRIIRLTPKASPALARRSLVKARWNGTPKSRASQLCEDIYDKAKVFISVASPGIALEPSTSHSAAPPITPPRVNHARCLVDGPTYWRV